MNIGTIKNVFGAKVFFLAIVIAVCCILAVLIFTCSIRYSCVVTFVSEDVVELDGNIYNLRERTKRIGLCTDFADCSHVIFAGMEKTKAKWLTFVLRETYSPRVEYASRHNIHEPQEFFIKLGNNMICKFRDGDIYSNGLLSYEAKQEVLIDLGKNVAFPEDKDVTGDAYLHLSCPYHIAGDKIVRALEWACARGIEDKFIVFY